jgi:putative spermidine/putrescine transport system substrate-binding protein
MAKGGTLKICSYGGSYQESQSKALIQPFADKFGVKIIEASGPDIAKVKYCTRRTGKPAGAHRYQCR